MAEMREGTRSRGRRGSGNPPGQNDAPGGETRTTTEASGEEIQSEAGGTRSEIEAKAREAGTELKEKTREAGTELKEKADEVAGEQKENVRAKAEALARALRAAGRSLEDEGEPDIASFGHRAADQVERMAGYLERKDTAGLFRDLEETARSNPGAFLASTLTAGLALGRFLRASSANDSGQGHEPGSVDDFWAERAREAPRRYAGGRMGGMPEGAMRGGTAGLRTGGAGEATERSQPGRRPGEPLIDDVRAQATSAGLGGFSAGGSAPRERVRDGEEERNG